MTLVEVQDVEYMAQAIHESGRRSVEEGKTVAAEKYGETTRKFLAWKDISETAREGRRIQARDFLERFVIFESRFVENGKIR